MNYTFDRVRIVMVNTTEAGNIGAAARAMKNMCLSRLYLVNPEGFPSAVATARASGADNVLSQAVVCNSLEQALKGSDLVIGASARQRNIKWQQGDVIKACERINKLDNTQEVAIVFGTEKSGLTNEELDLCQMLMTIPGNPEYFSLNVASAIQVFAYQYLVSNTNTNTEFDNTPNELANYNEVEGFYTHLTQVLEHIEYFEEKRPKALLMRRLRRFFSRSEMEKEEVAIFRGILRNIKPFKK
jgi:TrmH family RNA methyltransferase